MAIKVRTVLAVLAMWGALTVVAPGGTVLAQGGANPNQNDQAGQSGQVPGTSPEMPAEPGKMTPRQIPPNAQEILKNFEALVNRQGVPPEAQKLMNSMLGFMKEGSTSQDPEFFRGKANDLLGNLESQMQTQDIPPEAANMFKSFLELMKRPPSR